MHQNDKEALMKVGLFLVILIIAFAFASCQKDRYDGGTGKLNLVGDLISIVRK